MATRKATPKKKVARKRPARTRPARTRSAQESAGAPSVSVSVSINAPGRWQAREPHRGPRRD